MMDQKEKEIFDKFPTPKEGVSFYKKEVVKHFEPHLYCIGSKHLEYSSSICLNIEEAESKGAVCETCKTLKRKKGVGVLSYSEHKSELILMIAAPHKDLNAIEGLHEYLLSIKDLAIELNIAGFGFPLQ